jgi:hypothetical protein
MPPCSPPSPPPLPSNDSTAGGQAVTPELVHAMVPAQILHEDEIVLLLAKPSLFWILYSSAPFLLATALLGILAAQVSNLANVTPYTVSLIAVLVATGRLIWALLVWTSHIYMLTNIRILTIKGVINVHMFQAHLRKIQSTRVYRPLGQRLFSTGTLGFSTAAAAGAPESTWTMIHRPLETHEQILAAIHKSK